MNLGQHPQKAHKPCPRSSQYEKLTTANKRKARLNKLVTRKYGWGSKKQRTNPTKAMML